MRLFNKLLQKYPCFIFVYNSFYIRLAFGNGVGSCFVVQHTFCVLQLQHYQLWRTVMKSYRFPVVPRMLVSSGCRTLWSSKNSIFYIEVHWVGKTDKSVFILWLQDAWHWISRDSSFQMSMNAHHPPHVPTTAHVTTRRGLMNVCVLRSGMEPIVMRVWLLLFLT